MQWFIEQGMALTFKENRWEEFRSILKQEGCRWSVFENNLWHPLDVRKLCKLDLDFNEPTILYTSIDVAKDYSIHMEGYNLPRPGVWMDFEILRCKSYY